MNNIDKIRRSVSMIGESDKVIEMLSLISQVAATDISILVSGESGSGKEMVAKAIHKNSKRKFESLIIVNCAAIPSGIIESELFGHKKGSFTGAIDNKKGYFEEANKGSIFLDEIGELPKETQAKLLRVIESGEYIRVGESKSQKTDVRIIAATNRNLKDEVRKNNFRQDLYFRLKTINIVVPPLRKHLSDLPLFIERFGLEFTDKNDIPFKGFSSEAIALLKTYHWPGNIRELKNTVESLLVINKGQRIVPDMVKNQLNLTEIDNSNNSIIPINESSAKVERELILKQLLFLRQDINEIKQYLLVNSSSDKTMQATNPSLFLPADNKPENYNIINNDLDSISDARLTAIKDEAVGEITMNEIEKEIIERCLKQFKGNRRKTANALDISERTLYRKIKEYEL
tara:strand:+ start:60034 stop:61239 length:1206 start_codon:yes stop_codon:yes gene_type:complete